jgi:hypothetical protein
VFEIRTTFISAYYFINLPLNLSLPYVLKQNYSEPTQFSHKLQSKNIMSRCNHTLLSACFFIQYLSLAGQDLLSMQKTADDWEYICRNELHIEHGTLPWIIFYDSVTAWHINPEVAVLPAHKKLASSLRFAGVDYVISGGSQEKSLGPRARADRRQNLCRSCYAR